MFVRVKKIGGYEYLYLVENVREGGRHVQRVIKALGRRDEVEASGPPQAANRLIGEMCLGGAGAKAAGGLQRVFETHREMPPVEHDRGFGQRLTLQPPQPGIAVAQHRRRRVRVNSRGIERLLERIGDSYWGVADEGKTMLDSLSINNLTRDHLEVASFPAMPVAHIAAIKPDHD